MTDLLSGLVISGNTSPAVPIHDIEESLLSIWADILDINPESIGVDANLFVQGGANSLALIQLIGRIAEQFRVDLLLADVFAHPTINQLALMVQAARQSAGATAGPSKSA